MTGELRLCVFDLDGTLVDSQHHIVSAMATAFAAEGLQAPTPSDVRQIVGLPLGTAIQRLAPDAGGEQVERLGRTYRDAYFDTKATDGAAEPLFDGALDTLDALETAGWLLAIVTGKGRRGLLSVLDDHGVRRRFVSLKSADDGPGKPDPTLLLEAVAEAGVDRTRAVMVGDTVFDIRMAGSARVPAIGVSWGYHDPQALRHEGAATILERFDQLCGAADGLVAR